MADEQPDPKAAAPAGNQTQDFGAAKEPTWKKFDGMEKFNNEEDLAKAYHDLETKLGTQGDELGKAKEFAIVVQPLLEVVRDDPELFAQIDKKIRAKSEPTSQNNTPAKKEEAANPEIRDFASDLVIARFEEKYAIKELPPEEQKGLRTKIGDLVYELTGVPLTKVDLRRLSGILDKVYILANKDKLVKQEVLEAQMSANGNKSAEISSLPSKQGKGENESLTPEETRVATRMGLTKEQYLEGKKKASR